LGCPPRPGHLARRAPEQRKKVGGIMVSAALTAFPHGITEPIEFAFLFVAPVLYAVHAVLAGAAYFLCIASASSTASPSRTG
jgi:phosphotransferase system  glucose/maltose/N-acetylglucosamine-specific IIC component